MCGRKTLTRDMESIIEELAIEEWQDPESYIPSFNIAPTQLSPILVDEGHRVSKPMRWGLIPKWAKDESIGSKMINARAETILEKPSFQNLVPTQRCIVLADGYYEWKKTGSKSVPHYIKHPENKLLPMAGLWDSWTPPARKSPLLSYTVITTKPSNDLSIIHNRMPVILDHSTLDTWLQPYHFSLREAVDLLQPTSSDLTFYPVSFQVNSPRNNSPDCIRPLRDSSNLNLF